MNAYRFEPRAETKAARDATARVFGGLALDALNGKPSPDAWSAAQCLDHLRIANRVCSHTFDGIAEGRTRTTIAERIPLPPRLFGPVLRRAASPHRSSPTSRTTSTPTSNGTGDRRGA